MLKNAKYMKQIIPLGHEKQIDTRDKYSFLFYT